MNRVIISLMLAFSTLAFGGAAEAARAKFCATWKTFIADWDAGDYLVVPPPPLPDTTSDLAAKFTMYSITKGTSHTWVTGGLLDSSGCTPYITVTSGTYYFQRVSKLQYGAAAVGVLVDGWAWESSSPSAFETVEDDFLFRGPTGDTTVNAAPTALTDQSRLMPMLAQVVSRGVSTLDLASTSDPADIWVSTWFDNDIPGVEGQCEYEGAGGSGGTYRVCFANNPQHKFGIGHEIGHVVSKHRDSANDGINSGSEGYFRDPVDGYDTDEGGDGTHNCDTSLTGGHAHALHSREFTGEAQKEGFAQFISAASMNSRDNVGEFVYTAKEVMNWSNGHGGYFAWYLPGVEHWEPPFDVVLNNTHYAKWMEYECPPPTWFQHFATEWDWLDFYWNLWTYGSYKYTVAEINAVWRDTVTKLAVPPYTVFNDEIAYYCCDAYDADPDPDPDAENWIPGSCTERIKIAPCGVTPNLSFYWKEFEVGKLWDGDAEFGVTKGVLDTAYSKYGDPSSPTYNINKYNLFVNTSS